MWKVAAGNAGGNFFYFLFLITVRKLWISLEVGTESLRVGSTEDEKGQELLDQKFPINYLNEVKNETFPCIEASMLNDTRVNERYC